MEVEPTVEASPSTIKQIEENVTAAGTSLMGFVRYLLLANVGAVAITRDEIELFIGKLVERGEIAQKEAEKLLREVWGRVVEVQPGMQQVGARVEHSVEDLLNRLNLPSKHDIDDLTTKIAQLTASIEELSKN